MFWNNLHETLQRITVRLTLWYIFLFTVLLIAFLLLLDYSLRSILLQKTDAWLLQQMGILKAFDGELTTDLEAKGFQNTINWKSSAENPSKVFYLLLKEDNKLFISSDLTAWDELDASTLPSPDFSISSASLALKDRPVIFHTIKITTRKDVVRLAYMPYPNGMTAVVGISTDDNQAFITNVRRQFAIAFMFMYLFGGILGYTIAHQAMRGVERVTQTALSIDRDDLSVRVSLGREGLEIKQLATAFNNMLERIQTLVIELKEVTNNIAHDLRSPITSIRGIAETALNEKSIPDQETNQLGSIINECDRLISMINTTLEIAELDSGMKNVHQTQISLTTIVSQAHELFQAVAEDKNVALKLCNNHEVYVHANKAMIQRSVANLIDNAIKFTPEGGCVEVSCLKENSHALIVIKDTGYGVPEHERTKILNRFYRGDASRSLPGNGLGLSLAHSIIQAHGGEINIQSRLAEGSTFTIQLPITHN